MLSFLEPAPESEDPEVPASVEKDPDDPEPVDNDPDDPPDNEDDNPTPEQDQPTPKDSESSEENQGMFVEVPFNSVCVILTVAWAGGGIGYIRWGRDGAT
jgi:hypothetical protein